MIKRYKLDAFDRMEECKDGNYICYNDYIEESLKLKVEMRDILSEVRHLEKRICHFITEN